MDIIHSPQRIWLDISVGVALCSMLLFGSIYIYRLNNDARETVLDSALAMQGQAYSTSEGCVACHTLDGSPGVGPTWKDMFSRLRTLKHGKTVLTDVPMTEVYFRESVKDPGAWIVDGYPDAMLRYYLRDDEVTALMAFARQVSE